MAFLKFLRGVGLFLLYAVGLLVAGLMAAAIIAVFISVGAPDFLIKILMFGVLTFLGLVFLVGVGWVTIRTGLWLYLLSLPKQDAQVFYQAFPEYEESFLLEVRQIIAAHLKIETDRVPVELNLSNSSPLGRRRYELYRKLFDRFCPAASPAWELISLRTAGLYPMPAYVVEFPAQQVRTMEDLLREVDELRKGKVKRPQVNDVDEWDD